MQSPEGTDSLKAKLKRALVCWWFHRWHRQIGDRDWTRYFCWACRNTECGGGRMKRWEHRHYVHPYRSDA